jgi:predicted nucleic acid-binding protein
VRYLLDVNVLVALGHTRHAQHAKAENWLKSVESDAEALGTCAITELGFVRVSVQTGLQPDIGTAVLALKRMKATSPVKVVFWSDGLGVEQLPRYVRKPAELTDGHLLELARANRAHLATLDSHVPGALLLGS